MIPDLNGSHAIVGALVGVAFWLSRTLYVAVQQRRYTNGHDRRRATDTAHDDAIAWRAATTEQIAGLIRSMAATREDIHAIRKDDLNPLSLRLGLVERDVLHLQKHCPILEGHKP